MVSPWYGWQKTRKRTFATIQGWQALRAVIIERDNYACRVCGAGVDGGRGSLNVHHKDYDRSNSAHDNLVTLCADCHKQVHYEGYKPSLYQDYPEPWG